MPWSLLTIAVLLALAPVPPLCTTAAAAHSFEFVAEHLPEVAMDNRFATLPLWNGGKAPSAAWQLTVQGGGARTDSGNLALEGAMWSAATQRQLSDRWSIRAFGFRDGMRFSGTSDQRPLQTLFTKTPLALPADSLFTDLRGTYRNTGAGVSFNLNDHGWLGERQWIIGTLYQRVGLRDYRAAYRILGGPSEGATGFADYSGVYAHLTPFAGLALSQDFGSWSFVPHALFAVPVPRRGILGRITGPGFDLSGDTAKAGNGKHFGDISATIGLDITYRPWGLTLDVGSIVSQALLERVIHKGIGQNRLISASVHF